MASLIGNKPNQVPTNADLGNLAFQDAGNIAGNVGVGGNLTVSGTGNSSVAGNLGIGTSSPTRKLSVAGTANAYMDFNATSYRRFTVGSDSNGFIVYDEAASSYRMVLDASGNLGLGVTPSAWATVKALQVSNASLYGNGGSDAAFSQNAYYNAGWKYISTAAAAQYQFDNGAHKWFTAPSGTAGTAITFTQAMTLDASGNLGLGVTPSAWAGTVKAIEQPAGALFSYNTTEIHVGFNTYFDGGWKYKNANLASDYQQISGEHRWRIAPSGTAGTAITFTQAMTLDSNGNLIHSAPTTPPTLSTNGQMVFNLTSNTNLRVSVRGSDGVTRTANITLA